jgi:hypothetical protein
MPNDFVGLNLPNEKSFIMEPASPQTLRSGLIAKHPMPHRHNVTFRRIRRFSLSPPAGRGASRTTQTPLTRIAAHSDLSRKREEVKTHRRDGRASSARGLMI